MVRIRGGTRPAVARDHRREQRASSRTMSTRAGRGGQGTRKETAKNGGPGSGRKGAAVKAWKKAHWWHVHQIRHTFGTEARKRYGLEAAQVLLGHRNIKVTEVYAERDLSLAAKAAAEIG